MTCEELELMLPDGADGPEARAHLAGCERCRDSAAVLAMVAQPALLPSEKAKLVGLAGAVQTQWIRQQYRRSQARSVVGLAIAASLGAVIASGVMWTLKGAPQQAVQTRLEPEVLVLMEDSSPLASEDESSFEVSWPSLNDEGDVL